MKELGKAAKATAAWNVRAALREGISRLGEANAPSHALAAELLLMHALGRDRTWIYSHPDDAMTAGDCDRYLELLMRRAAGEPTQYLTGKQDFWGLEFEVDPSVLIPRPETEHVVEVALERLGEAAGRRAGAATRNSRIADVGTGSGCIAIALAKELPDAKIVATDISSAALEVAKRNAVRHGVAQRLRFIETDLLKVAIESSLTRAERSAASPPTFDLIVSNPPYVARDEAGMLAREVREHEPHAALFGGAKGTEIYERLVEQAGSVLGAGGILVLELGYDSAQCVRLLLERAAVWTRMEITEDLAGIPRVIAAEKASIDLR
jgi:release factor glutamine methyltransferase